jgi:hypothetical protein
MEPSLERQASDRRVDSVVAILAGAILLAWFVFLLWMASGLL